MAYFKDEAEFEQKLIELLTTGSTVSFDSAKSLFSEGEDFPLKTRLWEYRPDLKTTEQLWQNFKKILEQLNVDKLRKPQLSDSEFKAVKSEILRQTKTPFQAGKFLYGTNGVSQVEVDLDDGRHVFLTVFNQNEIGAGNTVYQVVNQVAVPKKIAGGSKGRFDVTLLINGLPIVQIELKGHHHSVEEALNQMKQYAKQNLYTDIFSTLQILVGMTPINAKYMANATGDMFNTDFAFNWQTRTTNETVKNWQEFTNSMLTIPMAHQMSTNYMILDGTTNKQMLKVMRPYQVYATDAVIRAIKQSHFDLGQKEVGYVWHTTGSGKTITSFKTAWLASRLPNVHKVVFVVDRIALTNQTYANYSAYDPSGDQDNKGSVRDTNNTDDLQRKLKEGGTSIIVTSVQKLGNLASRQDYVPPEKNLVFIVDEAHRSTSGEQFREIKKKFKRALWVGYTGTPMFEGVSTQEVFGNVLHTYTIREAIADKNVLGFKVNFKSTVDFADLLKQQHPDWTEEQIAAEIEEVRQQEFDAADNYDFDGKKRNRRGEQIEGYLDRNFYDVNQKHVELVVKDIFDNWRNRSNDYKYNALLTTHVSGRGVSTPLAIRYYQQFQKVNKERFADDERLRKGERPLKVAITYSLNTSNNESMPETNEALRLAILDYNETFGTSWGLDSISEYFEDLSDRLSKKVRLREERGEVEDPSKAYLDLVIVVDQLLTGFDAPDLNTLYVDRILKGAGLIQAYSRTNRIADLQEKPWGQIVNYRWPIENERLMNEALATYADRYASYKLGDFLELGAGEIDYKAMNEKDGILAQSYSDMLEQYQPLVIELGELTKDSNGNYFTQLPASEEKQQIMLDKVKMINSGFSKLKQFPVENQSSANDFTGQEDYFEPHAQNSANQDTAYPEFDAEGNPISAHSEEATQATSNYLQDALQQQGYDYNNPNVLLAQLGFGADGSDPELGYEKFMSLSREVKRSIANIKGVSLQEIELRMTHIKDIKVDYDYLTDLLNELGQQMQAGEFAQADETQKRIEKFSNGIEDPVYAEQVRKTAQAIRDGSYPGNGETWKKINSKEDLQETIDRANAVTSARKLLDFRNKWGITDVVKSETLEMMITNKRENRADLNFTLVSQIVTDGSLCYKDMSSDAEVQKLSKIKYRTALTEALQELVEKMSADL